MISVLGFRAQGFCSICVRVIVRAVFIVHARKALPVELCDLDFFGAGH